MPDPALRKRDKQSEMKSRKEFTRVGHLIFPFTNLPVAFGLQPNFTKTKTREKIITP